jgi:capsular exopolysaccharide synthesis family protein
MGTFNLGDYIRPLIRWWWLLAVATIIAAIASFLYVASQPSIYEAHATVMVGTTIQDLNPTGVDIFLRQQLADTYADLANRAPIRQATMSALGMDWLPFYSVTANSQLIEFKVYDQDPERTYVVAKELVNQMILQSPAGREQREHQTQQSFVMERLNKLQDSINRTEEEISSAENELLNINSARELAKKKQEITDLKTNLRDLENSFADLLATTQRGAVNVLQVLEPPSLPSEPIASNLLMNMIVAAVVGLSLATAGAYLLEFLDDSFKELDEVKKSLGVAVLGLVPLIPDNEANSGSKLAMMQTAPSSADEAYRSLRTNLQFASIDRSLRLLLVTSSQPEEGKSLTAANLSIALARAGRKVILVDADLHRPTVHRLFGLVNNIGVTTALLVENSEHVQEFLQPTIVPGLAVLTSGPLPPNPAELIGSRRMQEILNRLREQADIVVMDSPPVTAVVDGIILSTIADGVLLVVRANKTGRETARRAFNALQQVHARILGAVFNGVPQRSSRYYYYREYGYYNSAYARASATSGANMKGVEATSFVNGGEYDELQRGTTTPHTSRAKEVAGAAASGDPPGRSRRQDSARPYDRSEEGGAPGMGSRANGSAKSGAHPRRRSGLLWK